MHLEIFPLVSNVVPPLNDKYSPLVSALGDVYNSYIPKHVQCDVRVRKVSRGGKRRQILDMWCKVVFELYVNVFFQTRRCHKCRD